MKKQSWLLALNNIDEKYIEEAKPSSVKKFKKKKTLVLLAACMAVMFALSLVLLYYLFPVIYLVSFVCLS